MTGRQWLGLVLMGIGAVLVVVAVVGLPAAGSPPVAGASPSAAPTPSEIPSPTLEPTPEPTPLPTLGETDVRAFVEVLVAAVQGGDTDFLLAHLHPAVIDRYGEPACRAELSTFIDPTFDIDVLEVRVQASWDYVTDEIATTITNAWTVTANRSQGGVTVTAELHFAPADGTVRWFTDCTRG